MTTQERIEAVIREALPEIEAAMFHASSLSASTSKERAAHQDWIARDLAERIAAIPGLRIEEPPDPRLQEERKAFFG